MESKSLWPLLLLLLLQPRFLASGRAAHAADESPNPARGRYTPCEHPRGRIAPD